jgi:hypothetical protein
MKKLLCFLGLAAVLTATIRPESLWTDEAFSAYLACHRTFASLCSTLLHGDSSDLQMGLYYLFLHGWCRFFGESEIALRSANIPFILLFSGVLIWSSQRLFPRAPWVWIIAAFCPVSAAFASDTRPYFVVIALSLTCLTCLLVYLQSPGPRERAILPWLVLLALLLGAMFHMLTLLAGPPLMVLLAIFWRADRNVIPWRDWKWPLLVFSPLFLALLAYFAWTLSRGATYDYAHPDFLSMASVLYRFAGLSGFVPNRHYDIPIRPYLISIVLSALLFVSGMAIFCFQWSVPVRALTCGLAVGVAQVLVLSFALHQQIEFRHLSCLLPLLLVLMMYGLSRQTALARTAGTVLSTLWLISSIRLLTLPEYCREDFRSAVAKCLELQNSERRNGRDAVIAIAADPLAAAYYGLSGEGPAPCFPLVDSCQQGLSKVDWPRKSAALYTLFWSDAQIKTMLAEQRQNHSKVILLISRSRHPMLKDCAWWPVLATQSAAQIYPQHGFFVYLLNP